MACMLFAVSELDDYVPMQSCKTADFTNQHLYKYFIITTISWTDFKYSLYKTYNKAN